MRTWLPVFATFLALGLFAGCGGEEDEEADTTATTGAGEFVREISHTDPEATVTPEAVSPTPDLGVGTPTGCVPPTGIESYRLTFGMEGSALDSGLLGTTGGCRRGTSGFPFHGFPACATVEASYVAPDSWAFVVAEGGQEVDSYIFVGPQAWYKEAESKVWEEELASEEELDLLSVDLCEVGQENHPDLSGLQGEKETINGIAAVHYVISESPPVDASPIEESPDDEELLEEVGSTYEIWLAEEGNWTVRQIYDVSFEAGLEDYSLRIFWEISDLNDPSIVVEAPTLR